MTGAHGVNKCGFVFLLLNAFLPGDEVARRVFDGRHLLRGEDVGGVKGSGAQLQEVETQTEAEDRDEHNMFQVIGELLDLNESAVKPLDCVGTPDE